MTTNVTENFLVAPQNSPSEGASGSRRARLTKKYLEPADRLGEVLFGVIMVLTVTLTAGFAADTGKEGVRELLLAAIGCNIAWGFIDGIMYVMSCITERGAQARLMTAIQNAPNDAAALEIARQAVDTKFDLLTESDERNALYRSIVVHARSSTSGRVTVKKEDVLGAVACFWLVFISCLPAALPFLIFSTPYIALRVSNLLLVVMLFFIGMRWGYYACASRIGTGLIMAALGLVLVGVAIAFGG